MALINFYVMIDGRIYEYALNWDDLVLNPDDIYISMGQGYVPDKEMSYQLEKLKKEISRIIKPKCLFVFYKANPARKHYISVGELEFHTGVVITQYLAKAEYYAVMVATAGHEFQDFQQKVNTSGDIYKEYLLDSIGSAIAEAVAAYACSKIEEVASEYKWSTSRPYSPGYCGWHVSQQQLLFSLLPKAPCGIRLCDSSLMFPMKSVSALIAVGPNTQKLKYGCELCNKPDCYKNRSRLTNKMNEYECNSMD